MNTKEILTNIKAGLISGFFAILLAISLASFIFTGNLQPYLPAGIGMTVISTIILRLIAAKNSEVAGVVTAPSMIVCLFIALMSTSISNYLTQKGLSDQIFPTIMALIVVSTLSIAISLTLAGYFRLGSLVRYIPYPVICGLLAGVGLLMFSRGISIITGEQLTLNNLSGVFKWEILLQVLIGLCIASISLIMVKKKLNLFIKVTLILSFTILFFVAGKWINTSALHYWFIGPISSGHIWPPPLHFSDFYLINWSEILAQIPLLGTMNFILFVAFLVNLNGVEIFIKKDINIDRDLKITGIANFVTMIFGGIAGNLSAIQTKSNIQQGGISYLSAVTSSILALPVLLMNASILNYIPKSIMGGIIIFLGMLLLIEWGYQSKSRLPLKDYALVLVIIGITWFFGFLYGAMVGIIFVTAFFIYAYSQVNVVKYALNGDSYRSNVERSLYSQELLKAQGKHIYIVKMQGYIFFGTAYYLLKEIKNRLTDHKQEPIKYLILDFSLVNNLDSSAVLSFSKLFEMSKTLNFLTLFSHTNHFLLKQLAIASYDKTSDINYHFFPNLDFAMEWCENQILAAHSISVFEQTIPQNLLEILSFFEIVEYQKGEYVLHQGKRSSELYFILSGKVTVLFEESDGRKIRLKTISAGTFIGELGFFTGKPRSASVIAEIPTTLYRISKEKLEKIKSNNPHIVFTFYEIVARRLSERVADQNKTVELLVHEESFSD